MSPVPPRPVPPRRSGAVPRAGVAERRRGPSRRSGREEQAVGLVFQRRPSGGSPARGRRVPCRRRRGRPFGNRHRRAPAPAAYAPRVVIVVGPAGGSTSDYLSHATPTRGRRVPTGPRRPRSTPRTRRCPAGERRPGRERPHLPRPRQRLTQRVRTVADPDEGRPRPDPYDGSGNISVNYYGEPAVQSSIRLAPGAVVLLNRLCYALGAAEPGMAEPT